MALHLLQSPLSYRPPKHNSDFINEFAAFTTHLSSLSPNIILLGDFNIHMDKISNPLTSEFTSCLDSFGLQQHIHFPTHSKGHVLDLVCCSGVTPLDCTAAELPISDHMFISFTVNLTLSITNLPHVISFRNIKNINLNTLSTGINSLPSTDSLSSTDDLVSHYNNSLHDLFNTLAPLKSRSVSFTHSAPWYTTELRKLKAKGRQLERLCKKTGLVIHKEIYHNHILHYKDTLSTAKSTHYTNLNSSGDGNTRALFSTVNKLLRPPDSIAPHLYSTDYCNSLMSFFTTKIEKIHQQLTPNITHIPSFSTSQPLSPVYSQASHFPPLRKSLTSSGNPNHPPASWTLSLLF